MSDEILTMKIDGLAELRAKFKDLPDHLQTEVRGILERGAQKFVRNAKRDVTTVDNGTLRNGISYAMLVSDKNHITFQVFSGVYYSPFIEWGTLTNAVVPSELADYAAEFWTRSKKRGGIRPHPFFFKQIGPVSDQVNKDLSAFLNQVKL